MTFEQKLAVLIGAGIATATAIECLIRAWHALMRWATHTVARMVDDALDVEATDADEWADPWHATPTYTDPFANTRAQIAALETTEERA